MPTRFIDATLVLTSVPATLAGDQDAFLGCIERMGSFDNHVRPSWRDNASTPQYDPEQVALTEMSPNVFAADFFRRAVGLQNTMTVHDANECRRNFEATSRLTMGITLNGTSMTQVVGSDALLFIIEWRRDDHSVSPAETVDQTSRATRVEHATDILAHRGARVPGVRRIPLGPSGATAT